MKEFDPGDNAASIVSVTDRVRPVAIGVPVIVGAFPRRRAPPLSAPRKTSRWSSADGEISPVAVHGGGILCAASDGDAHRHGRRRRQARRARRERRGHAARDRRQTALDRQCRAASRRRGGVVGRQDGVCPRRQGRGKILRSALDGRRSGVRAKGPAACDRALQRRDAVVSQHGGEAGIAGMGGLASRRHVQPGQQVSGHRDARAGAARLAARRQPAHAHDRLSRPRPLDVVERGRQGAGDLRRRHRDRVAVRQQGRPDGQGAGDAGAAAGARLGGRLPSEAATSSPPATATAPS